MTRPKRRKQLPALTPTDLRFGTPTIVAEYRAERLCGGVNTVIEAGAGAGFQTQSFAKRVELVVAIDADEERLKRARFPQNVQPIAGDALDSAIVEDARKASTGRAIVFLDPQRPAGSTARTLAEIQPNPVKFVQIWQTVTPDIAIELPPFLSELPWEGEREYISVDGELNRLTIYLGSLRKCDISVVSLPSGERLEHTGPLPSPKDAIVEGKFILEPDRALERAGLTALALPQSRRLPLGKRSVYLSDERPKHFFKSYKLLGLSEVDELSETLTRYDAGTIILHGSLTQEEQTRLLRQLNPSCTGSRRLHIFLGEQAWIGERLS